MDVFSPEFLILFFLAAVIVTLRARRKKGPTVLPEKQIAIKGQQVATYLSKDTPLICLLADGRIFGDDFQDKEIPKLPHQTGCRCELKDILRRSRELFDAKTKESSEQQTDLGKLKGSEARYYRFILIAHHQDASDQLHSEYLELAQNISTSHDFIQQIEDHLFI